MADESRKTTKTITQMVDDSIEKRLADVHTSLPAEIVSFTGPPLNLADVKITLKRKYVSDDAPIEMPIIKNVPVAFYRLGNAWVRLPVETGNTGQLIFCERSIDKWKISGGTQSPDDPRKFSLADAVFYPGLSPQTLPMISQSAATSLEVKNGIATIEMTPTGKFKMGNGVINLLQILDDVVTQLMSAFVVDPQSAAPVPLDPATLAKLALAKAQLSLIKG